jgi:DNA-binding SARP family transcriptional activator/pimeloyl-ACP methyl ester carboxylesterase
MGEGPDDEVELRLIGPLAVLRGGAPQKLPTSRKTRALLAFLAISGKPERRDALCDLLWDLPDDPRAALRWSLTKLRPLVDGDGRERLRGDRDWVELDLPDGAVDWRRLRAVVKRGVATSSTDALEPVAAGGELLEGLEVARCDRFQAWLVAQREDVRQWRAAVLAELSGRDLPVETALAHARAWIEIDGDSPRAWSRLVELLDRAGRAREAAEQRHLAERRLAAAGAPVPASMRAPAAPRAPAAAAAPEVRLCRSADGTGLAFAVAGEGPPIVKIANVMTHLELDAQGPIWRHWISEFSRGRRLLRYDHRGGGLSDRNARLSFEAELEDVEAVVEAAGLDRFDLLGISFGASVAVAYAVRHPERVRRLVLLGGFPCGWKVSASPDHVARREAMLTLARDGWDADNPAFRQIFTSLFLPDGSPEAQGWFTEVQRTTISAATVADYQLVSARMDVRPLLSKVAAPTLVAHCRGDAMVPFEAGRALAAAIPGARFLALEGRNHVLLEGDSAWPRFVEAVGAFLEK